MIKEYELKSLSLKGNSLFLGVISAGIGLTLILSGCGSDSSDSDTAVEKAAVAATQQVANATATAATATSSPTESTVTDAYYPKTVEDLLDREVTIVAPPDRIVALSPSALEYLYALGGVAVGRPSSARYPEAAMSVESVGTSYAPNFESILGLNPDLIIADSIIQAQPRFLEQFKGLPAPVFLAGAGSYSDVLTALERLGVVLNRNDEAQAEITRIQTSMEAAKSVLPPGASAIVLIADRDNTFYAAKNTSFVGDVMDNLGVVNPASDLPDAGPFPGFSTASIEILLSWNPDFIFTITPAPEPAPRLSTLLPSIPPMRGLSAVQSGSILELPLEIALQAPGPRVDQLVKLIVESLAQ
ncbi:MAG TPA: ABC transporter substrate-binding protein [Dehalococcoidia bacterium]|nr:ABC transporter substrate-binding protein [Dehalococcoidia bacterium]